MATVGKRTLSNAEKEALSRMSVSGSAPAALEWFRAIMDDDGMVFMRLHSYLLFIFCFLGFPCDINETCVLLFAYTRGVCVCVCVCVCVLGWVQQVDTFVEHHPSALHR